MKGIKNLVSIVIPACNEEATIGKVLREVYSEIPKIKNRKFEVIVVVNRNGDQTDDIAKKFGAIVIYETAKGKGSALREGFSKSKGEYIIMMDADYSHEAKDIRDFLRKLDDGYGLVVGSRLRGGSDEWDIIRSFGNYFLSSMFKWFFGTPFTDSLNGYKAFRREVFDKFNYRSTDLEIEIELIANAVKLTNKIADVRTHERARAGGKMKSFAPYHGPRLILKIFHETVRYYLFKWGLPGSGAKK
jgi:glycosyltransferase involved in cell wall biosynthesis